MFWNSTYTPQRSFITVFHFYCLPGINPSLAGRAIGAQRHLLRVQWNTCFHFLATFGGFTLGPCSCILLSLLVLCRKLSEESTHRGKLINTWCYQATCSVLSQAHAMYTYIFCFQWKLLYMSTWYFLNMCEWLIRTYMLILCCEDHCHGSMNSCNRVIKNMTIKIVENYNSL